LTIAERAFNIAGDVA